MDDLCAEVFLAILADDFAILRRFKEESSLATYLAVISRRIVVREIVRRRMSETLGHSKLGNSSVDGLSNESADAQRIDNRDLVERMLDGLPEREAAVVRQFHLEGLTYHEISHKLGVPENSIGPTLTRARERLRRAVAQA
jgi:RNA polymerase sigma-70 factor (ECF subfamily)